MTVIPRLSAAQLRLLHLLVREGSVAASGYQVRPMKMLVRQGLAELCGSVYVPTDYAREVVTLPELALPANLPREQRQGTHGWMRSKFVGRSLPEVIWLGEEAIVGPFCVHCGNPSSLHGDGGLCPDRILHPVFPPPTCKCHAIRVTAHVTTT